MTAININQQHKVRIVRINGVFHKVFMKTICALNIQNRGSSALSALSGPDSWREVRA